MKTFLLSLALVVCNSAAGASHDLVGTWTVQSQLEGGPQTTLTLSVKEDGSLIMRSDITEEGNSFATVSNGVWVTEGDTIAIRLVDQELHAEGRVLRDDAFEEIIYVGTYTFVSPHEVVLDLTDPAGDSFSLRFQRVMTAVRGISWGALKEGMRR